MHMRKLNPKTEYEIKVATLSRAIELPGIFRTITDRNIRYRFYNRPSITGRCPTLRLMHMRKLNPKTEYEIKVATLSRAIELPGIFRTITDRNIR